MPLILGTSERRGIDWEPEDPPEGRVRRLHQRTRRKREVIINAALLVIPVYIYGRQIRAVRPARAARSSSAW